jgi:hypothetical protein
MRYQIVDIIYKETKVNIKCRDLQERILLKISLTSDTLECTDMLIPDSLQRFIELNQDSIRRYLNYFIHKQIDTVTSAR